MTSRLVDIADQYWSRIDGWTASRNVDPMELPIDRFLALVYFWAVDGMEEEDFDAFESRLWQPPKGVEVTEGPWSAEAETSAFQGFKQQVNG